MDTIISKDGTHIAYNKMGKGPAMILVDGAFCSKDFGPMVKIAPVLAENFTVFAYDRRARGDSGDKKPYDIRKEIEDIDALITLAGGPAYLFGISSGAILCIHTVAAGLNITKLALFEPPYVGNKENKRSVNAAVQLKDMINAGKKADAVKFYLRKVIGVPAIIPFILRFTSNWRKMIANANSLPYDAAICGDFNIPKEQMKLVTIPTIVLDSDKSPKILRDAVQKLNEALPNSQRKTLKGHIHGVAPEILVPVLTWFFNAR